MILQILHIAVFLKLYLNWGVIFIKTKTCNNGGFNFWIPAKWCVRYFQYSGNYFLSDSYSKGFWVINQNFSCQLEIDDFRIFQIPGNLYKIWRKYSIRNFRPNLVKAMYSLQANWMKKESIVRFWLRSGHMQNRITLHETSKWQRSGQPWEIMFTRQLFSPYCVVYGHTMVQHASL